MTHLSLVRLLPAPIHRPARRHYYEFRLAAYRVRCIVKGTK